MINKDNQTVHDDAFRIQAVGPRTMIIIPIVISETHHTHEEEVSTKQYESIS